MTNKQTIKIGSLFSGIGGFELGLERAIPGSKTVWQCEQDAFCQKILAKHWPDAIIYDDVRTINNQVEPIDILCGGFPCQDISIAGEQRGIHEGKKSSLWWEMHRIIGILEPRIIVLENVAAITSVGGTDVIGSLAQIGYDCQWSIISAAQCGAPHRRNRWFAVAYPQSISDSSWNATNTNSNRFRTQDKICTRRKTIDVHDSSRDAANPGCKRFQEYPNQLQQTIRETSSLSQHSHWRTSHSEWNYWKEYQAPSAVCRVDDGIPNRVDRLKALGNAIVPQCSEWIGSQLVNSGLIDDLLER